MFKNIFWFVFISCGYFVSAYNVGLIGGEPASPGEFGEVVRIRSGSSGCTAAVVGPNVLLTAAHCVNGPVSFTKNNITYEASCSIAPDYKSEVGDQDIALCKIGKTFPGPYASVSKVGPRIGDEVTLIGYGCTNPGGGGGNDGILRYGSARVTRESDNDYYTFHALGNSALCFGDSGGPSFKLVSDKSQHRFIYGVNSRGNIQDLSLLAAVYHPKSIDFFEDFEREYGVLVCGIGMFCDVKDHDPHNGNCEGLRRAYDLAKTLYDVSLDNLNQCTGS